MTSLLIYQIPTIIHACPASLNSPTDIRAFRSILPFSKAAHHASKVSRLSYPLRSRVTYRSVFYRAKVQRVHCLRAASRSCTLPFDHTALVWGPEQPAKIIIYATTLTVDNAGEYDNDLGWRWVLDFPEGLHDGEDHMSTFPPFSPSLTPQRSEGMQVLNFP